MFSDTFARIASDIAVPVSSGLIYPSPPLYFLSRSVEIYFAASGTAPPSLAPTLAIEPSIGCSSAYSVLILVVSAAFSASLSLSYHLYNDSVS